MKQLVPESPTIRPPSEWRSLLIRITRGCKWNRCKFCGLYPALGQPEFSIRCLEEIIADIDFYREHRPDAETAFLADSDPLIAPEETITAVMQHLKQSFPSLIRTTTYARASTLHKKGLEGIKKLSDMGIDRVHIGLESGNQEMLNFHKKGQTRDMILEVGRWLKEADIEISMYVLLGLGGRDEWKNHMDSTSEVLNAVNPEFIRIRRLWIYEKNESGMENPESPLWTDIRSGKFSPQTPEGTVIELKRLLERLKDIDSFLTCDHSNNFVRVKGKLPGEKEKMLQEVLTFLNLPEKEREAHYRLVGDNI